MADFYIIPKNAPMADFYIIPKKLFTAMDLEI